ncbi:hypothetical protein AgCh_027142 [Apium graveolens]
MGNKKSKLSQEFKIKGGRRIYKIALVAIYQGIPEDMLLSIAEKTTAKEAWETIKTMCLGADRVKKAKVQILKADFESLKMKDTKHLDEFYMKLNSLMANIQALGEVIEESGDNRVREVLRNGRDKSMIRYFNCLVYGHYDADCRKPKREKEQRLEVNMSQTKDDEPALLMIECGMKKIFLSEEKLRLRSVSGAEKKYG